MKKKPANIDEIKRKILELKGQVVELYVNRGRRKVSSYRARIEDVYSSVFTVRSDQNLTDNIYTYSYNDILCGEVKITNDWRLN